MKNSSFFAKESDLGKRIDLVMTAANSDSTRSFWHSEIEKGHVMINGQKAKPSYKIKSGDKISHNVLNNISTPLSHRGVASSEVLFMNNEIIVINKPAGVSVYSPNNSGASTIATEFADKINYTDGDRSGIVHRLDKNTSGVMVLARTLEAKNYLQSEFKNRKVQKTYIALVAGILKDERAKIDLPIARDKSNPTRMKVQHGGKRSLSEYKVIKYYSDYSLVEIKLYTGRTHQIRVQFAHIGHPVVGDSIYAKNMPKILQRQFLHAKKIAFSMPLDGSLHKYQFEADLPNELKKFLKEIE